MAFSTQKQFIHVAFMNECPEPTCLFMEAVTLKRYASTFDERAWMPNDYKRSRYLADLVACRMYTRDENGDCGQPFNISERAPSLCNTTTAQNRVCEECDLQSIGKDSLIGATVDMMGNIESMCLDT